MKARCIDFTGDRATVLLAPNWLGYLFGRRSVCVDVEYVVRAACDGYRERRGTFAKPRLSLVGDEAVMP